MTPSAFLNVIMKRILSILITFLISSATATISAQGIMEQLGKYLGNSSTTQDSADKNSGGLLDAIGSLFGGDIKIKDLCGTWGYVAPAVSFKSENLLKKAGGAAASAVVENKLKPVYKTTGFDKMEFNVNADSTFSMKVRMVTLKGQITTDVPKGSTATFMFKFKVAGKISMGKMEAYVKKSGNKMTLTFDVTKLMSLISKVGAVSGNSSLKTLSKLLDNYDGMCAGFEMKRTAEATGK